MRRVREKTQSGREARTPAVGRARLDEQKGKDFGDANISIRLEG